MTRLLTVAVIVLCFALTIALAVVGLRWWQAEERKEAHIDWLMKKYRTVSYNCVAYDECTDAERWIMANCGKPSGVYRGSNPQADAAEDSSNRGRRTEELEQTKKNLLDNRVTGNGCLSAEDIEGMVAGIDRELGRRKTQSRFPEPPPP